MRYLALPVRRQLSRLALDRKSTRLNSSHSQISYAVFCLKKKNITRIVTAYSGSSFTFFSWSLTDICVNVSCSKTKSFRHRRSEEDPSEIQSPCNRPCRPL